MGRIADLFRTTQAPEPVAAQARSAWNTAGGWPAWFAGHTGSTFTPSVQVTPRSALGVAAVWRAVSIIAGVIASLPLKTYRRDAVDDREPVPSWLDAPGGPYGPDPYAWKHLLMTHLLLDGNAFGFHLRTSADKVAEQLIPPHAVRVREDRSAEGGKVFEVSTTDGVRVYGVGEITHYMGLSIDGLRGMSPIAAARQGLSLALAADSAAERMFTQGMLLGGLVQIEDADEAEVVQMEAKLNDLTGTDNAGRFRVTNMPGSFTPWTMNAADAQFLETRQHQIEEVCRWYGLPKSLLAQDGASTWGAGIAELFKGMQRFTFAPWTSMLESIWTRQLTRGHYAEFDYRGLIQPTPSEELDAIVRQVEAQLLTVDEARALLGRPSQEV